MKYAKELAVAKKAAREAGRVTMRYFGRRVKKYMKGSRDYALEADIKAEKVAIGLIRKSFPGHNILAEESGTTDKGSEYTWLIDPLDGTHNFLFQVPLFGTSVALQRRHEVVAAALCLPYSRELYAAARGSGASCNNRKISVSKKRSDPSISFGGVMHFGKGMVARNLSAVVRRYHHDFRALGSAVFSAACVASGKLDCYIIFYTNPWDIAAGALLVEEAGGKVTDARGNRWNPYQSHFVMSNGLVHKKVMDVLRV